jgi:hypothetical protein
MDRLLKFTSFQMKISDKRFGVGVRRRLIMKRKSAAGGQLGFN